jgi:hypothetical protein
MRALHQVAVFACAIVISIGVYAHGTATSLPRKQISSLLVKSKLPICPLFWSEDGKFAAPWIVFAEPGEQHRVLDTISLRAAPLPFHKGTQGIWYLDSSRVVRWISTNEKRSLYLYRFADNSEILIPTEGIPCTSNGQVVSPNKRFLCWLEQMDNKESELPKVYDMDEGRVDTLKIALPKVEDVRWSDFSWADDKTIAIRGHPARKKFNVIIRGPLHILLVDIKDRSVEHRISSHESDLWCVSPDSRHAFGVNKDDKEAGAYYVNLESDESVLLGGKKLPVWQEDSRYAYRTKKFAGEGTWLCRFDPTTAKEERVFPVSEDMEMVGLSSRGRFAFLRLKGNRFWPFFLVDVVSGKQRRLDISWGFAICITTTITESWFPRISYFSPDERRFVLSHNVAGDWTKLTGLLDFQHKTYLYEIPEEWLKQSPPAK